MRRWPPVRFSYWRHGEHGPEFLGYGPVHYIPEFNDMCVNEATDQPYAGGKSHRVDREYEARRTTDEALRPLYARREALCRDLMEVQLAIQAVAKVSS